MAISFSIEASEHQVLEKLDWILGWEGELFAFSSILSVVEAFCSCSNFLCLYWRQKSVERTPWQICGRLFKICPWPELLGTLAELFSHKNRKWREVERFFSSIEQMVQAKWKPKETPSPFILSEDKYIFAAQRWRRKVLESPSTLFQRTVSSSSWRCIRKENVFEITPSSRKIIAIRTPCPALIQTLYNNNGHYI